MKWKHLLTLVFGLALAADALFAFRAWDALRHPVVLVEWSTASELDTVGFNLYRSENPGGPFVQVNRSLIPASTDPLSGGSYTYRDEAVQPGRDYLYELEEVSASGQATRVGQTPGQARGQGGLELVAAGVLGLICLFGLFTSVRPARRPALPAA